MCGTQRALGPHTRRVTMSDATVKAGWTWWRPICDCEDKKTNFTFEVWIWKGQILDNTLLLCKNFLPFLVFKSMGTSVSGWFENMVTAIIHLTQSKHFPNMKREVENWGTDWIYSKEAFLSKYLMSRKTLKTKVEHFGSSTRGVQTRRLTCSEYYVRCLGTRQQGKAREW